MHARLVLPLLVLATGCGGSMEPLDSKASDTTEPDAGDLTIDRIVPDSGPSTGGTSARVTGTGFTADLQVTVGGEPLDMEKTYGVVSNNYVRNGGDGYKMFSGDDKNAYDFGPDLADVTAEYLAANAPYQPYTDGRIAQK